VVADTRAGTETGAASAKLSLLMPTLAVLVDVAVAVSDADPVLVEVVLEVEVTVAENVEV